MNRRAYLGAVTATGGVALSGCLDGLTGSGDETVRPPESEDAVLEPPEWERDLSGVAHPTYGQRLPSFSVHDPLADEPVTDEQFRGERAILLTFYFTSCPAGVCPGLIQRLVNVQPTVASEGFTDEVAFLAMTFDPEHDTAEVFDDEVDRYGIDLDAGNWHFLRPESPDRAKEIVGEDFGNPVQRVPVEEADHGGDGNHEGHDGHDDGGTRDDHNGHGETDGHGDHEYTFEHYDLILLANKDGVVERSYPQATAHVSVDEIEADLLAVLERHHEAT